ncbi:hypothetical protein B0J13DRAFT_575356 [Dactylonectria estremocensis]|uniref:Uncharacterized protein n=1 Tax=Dactylonectria estremocensis TaxID=1079267 RepID=A0A9P9D4W9_9HYPO|nr:hypothetical protein B0J13DRAFT_575356 [Dactylonectria estremocensis]
MSEVRRVRDVTFNEEILYNPKDHPSPIKSHQHQQLQLQLPDHIETDSEDEVEFRGIRPIQPEGSRSEDIDDEEVYSTIEVAGDEQSHDDLDGLIEGLENIPYPTPRATGSKASSRASQDNSPARAPTLALSPGPTPASTPALASAPDLGYDGDPDLDTQQQPRRRRRQPKGQEPSRRSERAKDQEFRSSFFLGREGGKAASTIISAGA